METRWEKDVAHQLLQLKFSFFLSSFSLPRARVKCQMSAVTLIWAWTYDLNLDFGKIIVVSTSTEHHPETLVERGEVGVNGHHFLAIHWNWEGQTCLQCTWTFETSDWEDLNWLFVICILYLILEDVSCKLWTYGTSSG